MKQYLTTAELQVIVLSSQYSIRQIKDAIQRLHTTDISKVEAYLSRLES
jgi:hypothetical protein